MTSAVLANFDIVKKERKYTQGGQREDSSTVIKHAEIAASRAEIAIGAFPVLRSEPVLGAESTNVPNSGDAQCLKHDFRQNAFSRSRNPGSN